MTLAIPYIWRIDRLTQQLSEGPLSQPAALFYVVLAAGSTSVTRLLPARDLPLRRFAELTNWLGFIILILGIVAAYVANGGGRGVDFSSRFMALVVVVGIRVTVLGIIPSAALAALISRRFPSPQLSDVMQFYSVLGLRFVTFWRIAHHLRRVNVARPAA